LEVEELVFQVKALGVAKSHEIPHSWNTAAFGPSYQSHKIGIRLKYAVKNKNNNNNINQEKRKHNIQQQKLNRRICLKKIISDPYRCK